VILAGLLIWAVVHRAGGVSQTRYEHVPVRLTSAILGRRQSVKRRPPGALRLGSYLPAGRIYP